MGFQEFFNGFPFGVHLLQICIVQILIQFLVFVVFNDVIYNNL